MEKQPKWGPGYQPVNAVLYRIEYAILFPAVVAYLGWRGTQLAGDDATMSGQSRIQSVNGNMEHCVGSAARKLGPILTKS